MSTTTVNQISSPYAIYGNENNILFNNDDFHNPKEDLAEKILKEYVKNKES